MIYDSSGTPIQNTVLELMNLNHQPGYIVHTDKYYNSLCMAKQLHEQNTRIYGKLRNNWAQTWDLMDIRLWLLWSSG
jgi:hypothetical protein